MSTGIVDFIKLYQFSTGRRLYTFGEVLKVAEPAAGDGPGVPDPELAALVREAIAHDQETQRKEGLWRTARANKTTARGRAAEIDAQIDRVLGSMHSTVQALLAVLPPGGAEAERTRRFLRDFFPEGAGAITSSSLEDELATVEDMLREIDKLPQEELAALHIGFFVNELRRLAPLLADELRKPVEEAFRFDELRKARRQGHENLLTLVSGIFFRYRGEDPEKVEARRALMRPIADQNARVSARRRRSPAPDVDVDPVTGQEIEREAGDDPGEEPS